jgi:hypothetical protein
MKKTIKPWRKTFASVALTIITVGSFVLLCMIVYAGFFGDFLSTDTSSSSVWGPALAAIVVYGTIAIPLTILLIALNFIYPARWVLFWTILLFVTPLLVVGVPMYLENVMGIRTGLF